MSAEGRMIQVEGLQAGYRAGFTRRWKEVLRGVSFDVRKGSVTGYLGVNGAGKTTTIKILVGINRPAGGTVTIGEHAAGTQAAQRKIGYFPEAPFFYDGLTALELLAFFGKLHGVDPKARDGRAASLLDEVGLSEAANLPIREYSKGMRQRLGLAQALIHEPELLVLDEPLDGLDPMGRLQLRELIARQGERGTTIFFSSHVLSDVEVVCDHLVVLDGGQIAYQGPTQELGSSAETVSIQFQAEDDALAAIEEAAGVAPRRRGDGSHDVECPDQATADAVVDAVRAGQGQILSLTSHRPSLEETFLALFGGKAEATP